MEDRYRTDPARQRTRRAAAPHGDQPRGRSAQADPAAPRSAAAYDRSRYRARNRDGSTAAQPQRSAQAPQRSRSSVYDTGAGVQRQRSCSSRSQAPAASRQRALPDEPQRRVRGSRQQQHRAENAVQQTEAALFFGSGQSDHLFFDLCSIGMDPALRLCVISVRRS